MSQQSALLQSIFRDERMAAAVANHYMWQSLGFALQFFMGAMVPNIEVHAMGLLVMLFVAQLSFDLLPSGLEHDPEASRPSEGIETTLLRRSVTINVGGSA